MARFITRLFLLRTLVLSLMVFVLVRPAYSQVLSIDDTTSPQTPGVGHDYIKMLGESVNPANGSVSLRIDLPTPKGRGLDIPFAILYSSSGIAHVLGNINGGGVWGTDTGLGGGSGWSYSVPTLTAVQGISSDYHPGPPPVTYKCYYYYSYILHDWTGAAHLLNAMQAAQNPSDGTEGCSLSSNQPSSSLTGSDDFFKGITTVPTNLYLPNPVTAAGPDGTVYQFSPADNILGGGAGTTSYWGSAHSIEDRNGNVATTSFHSGTNGVLYGSVGDTLGRQAVSVSALASNTNTVSVSGQSAPYTQHWTSVPVNFSVTFTGTDSPPCTITIAPDQSSNYVVQTLTLTNGKSFQFTYDSTYGLLNKIVYPGGGYIKYTWGLNLQSEHIVLPGPPNPTGWLCNGIYDYPAITQRTVSYDGVNIAEQQTFSYSTTWAQNQSGWTSKQTTVTTYDNVRGTNHQTVYAYGLVGWPAVPMERSIVYKDFSGAVLKTVTKAWIDPLLLGCQLETLDNGSTSGAWYFYGPGGQMTDKKEYDYGLIGSTPCQPGSTGTVSPPPSGVTPTRETVTTYKNFVSTPIFPSAPSIFDKPASVITYDKGSRLAETDYGYDQTAVLPVSPTATGHDGTNYSASYNNRGNLATRTVKCLQIGCVDAVTTYIHDETGQVTSIIDPCGNSPCSDMAGTNHTTTFSYTDNYSSGTPPGNTNAYLTRKTDPLGHAERFAYNYNDGHLTSATDVNGKVTSYIYNTPPSGCSFADGLGRLSEVDYPDGGKTTYCYNDTAPSPSVTKTTLIDNTVSPNLQASTTTVTDGVGHVVRTQLTTDPEGTDTADTTFDGLGRAMTQSNPYRNLSDPTYGITAHTYDSLGRVNLVVQADGSAGTTSYSGNCTTVTDETGKLRKSCSDGLGRLVEVDEPGAGAAGATSSTGAITLSGSEQSMTGSAKAGSGTVAINGSEQSVWYYPCGVSSCPTQVWDNGGISITVNGFTANASYGQSSTTSSLASLLVSGLNLGSSPVTATLSGTVITITAKTTGGATNYSLSATSSTNNSQFFSGPSFWGSPSGSTLTGGKDAGTVYDTGTVSVTVNGFTANVPYSQTVNNTSALIASSLASIFNGSESPVVASVSGSVITLNTRELGSSSNYAVSTADTWSQTFSNPSFVFQAPVISSLTGGTDGSLGSAPLVTLYLYDALNNVTCAVQKGGDTAAFTTCAAAPVTWRPRSFQYDSLSRIISATNPESGTILYSYDANGSLAQKTSPKPNQGNRATTTNINFCYDPLNRGTSKAYNTTACPPTSPVAAYIYDQGINGIGHRTGMTDSPGSTSWTYDVMGRVASETRVTSSVTKSTSYVYNQAGSVKTIIYPSSRRVNYIYSGTGRILSAVDPTGPINYVTAATYAPSGELATATNGFVQGVFTGINTANVYNSRLQPVLLSATSPTATVLSLCYDFHSHVTINLPPCVLSPSALGDNGNVYQIVNNRDGNRTQNFSYDNINRISQAYTTGSNWGETFTIDPWGNLTNRGPVAGKTNYEPLNAPALTNNQLTGFGYDAAGNLTSNVAIGYNYDTENRLTKFIGGTTDIYVYDGDGQRVKKNASSVTLYWYGATGNVLDETSASGTLVSEYIFFNGKRVARRDADNSVKYYFSDNLGSASVITNSTGAMPPLEESDYYPYGGEIPITNGDPNHYKFTGKERDTESGLDNFGARFFTSNLGRFMTPDWAARPTAVPYAVFGDPQSLNLYTYVENAPVNRVDADGHYCVMAGLAFWCSADNPPAEATKEANKTNQAQNTSLASDVLNIVEVSGSAGVGSHGEIQVGTVEFSGGYNVIGVEGTTGLAGGNANATVLTGVQGEAKVPGASVEGKAGAELSTKDGATLGATVTGHAGPVSGEVKVDTSGVHTSAKMEANKDIKLGLHMQIGLGVGVTVNLSQAARAAERARQSGLALANSLYNKFVPSGSIF